MYNYCPSIEMPPAREVREKRPYDVPVRPESIIDLNFERTRQQKISAILGLARCSALLGQIFRLRYDYSFAIPALERYEIPYMIVGKPEVVAGMDMAS